MWLSLTYDHRAIYGGQAARFLATLAETLGGISEERVGIGAVGAAPNEPGGGDA
jgi:hypothetical protein